MSKRDELIKELCDIKDVWDKDELTGKSYEDRIADFIISREAKIVEPLVELRKNYINTGWPQEYINDAIDQTLKNAGVKV